MQYLTQIIKSSKQTIKIKDLNISRNDIGNHAIEQLMEAVDDKTQINIINIQQTTVNTEATERLFASLKLNRYMTKIDFSNNDFSYAEEVPLFQLAVHNVNLKYLELSYTRLGDDAVNGLFRGLLRNNSLTTIKLRQNQLTDVIGDTLMELLFCPVPNLKCLDLAENQLTDVTGLKIGSALQYNK